jgi:hypothetical protein
MSSEKNVWWERLGYIWPLVLVSGTFLVGYGSWSTKAEQICKSVYETEARQSDFEKRLIPMEVAVKEIPEMRAEIRRILEIVLSLKRRD